jgi:uncharacterized protein (DUF362 family)
MTCVKNLFDTCGENCAYYIDVVKTRMQTNPQKFTLGVLQAAKDIVASDGVGVLLTGLGECAVCVIPSTVYTL